MGFLKERKIKYKEKSLKSGKQFYRRIFCIFIIMLSLLANFSGTYAANSGGVVAAPGGGTTAANDSFEKAVRAVVIDAFKEQALTLAPEVTALVTTQIDAMSKTLETIVTTQKANLDNLTTDAANVDLNFSSLPSQAEIDNIPAAFLGQASAAAQSAAARGIEQQFESTSEKIRQQVSLLMDQAIPQVKAAMKPAVEKLILSINELVEKRITNSIEAKIQAALPEFMEMIPKSMKDLTPEQIAEKMEAKLRPGIEAEVRPILKDQIKGAIEALVKEKIEGPVSSKLTPKILSMEVTAYDAAVSQVPSYIEKLVSKEYVKSIVRENVLKLQTALPALIQSEQDNMQKSMRDYIEKEIESTIKVYVNGKRYVLTATPKIIKNVLFIPTSTIEKLTGAKVQYVYAKKQVILKKDKNTVVFTLNSNIVLLNGKKVKVDTAAALDGKQPILPAEIMTEFLGYKFEWQPDWDMATITK